VSTAPIAAPGSAPGALAWLARRPGRFAALAVAGLGTLVASLVGGILLGSVDLAATDTVPSCSTASSGWTCR
jgi:hypothetical protein